MLVSGAPALTFAAPGCQQPRRLPEIIGDLHISSEDHDCFDHIQAVVLGDKGKLNQKPCSPQPHLSFPPSSFPQPKRPRGLLHNLTFMARCSGVLPSWPLALVLAPCVSSTMAQSKRPLLTAMCRAMSAVRLLTFTSEPYFSSSCVI